VALHCASKQKVAVSIPDGVTGIFHGHNLFNLTMALGSTQSVTVSRTFSRVKGGQCVWLTNLPSSYAYCHENWEPQPPGSLRDCPGLNRDWFSSVGVTD
jgi:hypothetical protein